MVSEDDESDENCQGGIRSRILKDIIIEEDIHLIRTIRLDNCTLSHRVVNQENFNCLESLCFLLASGLCHRVPDINIYMWFCRARVATDFVKND